MLLHFSASGLYLGTETVNLAREPVTDASHILRHNAAQILIGEVIRSGLARQRQPFADKDDDGIYNRTVSAKPDTKGPDQTE